MHRGTLPLGWLAVVLNECWPILLLLITLLLWLFPDGRLPGGRWHRPARVAAAGWLLVALATSSRGVLVVAGHDVRSHANGDLANPLPGALLVLSVVVIVGTLANWTAWLVIQIPTYRHADGERREQLKWLYSGAAIFGVAPGNRPERRHPSTCPCQHRPVRRVKVPAGGGEEPGRCERLVSGVRPRASAL
jgi:hypothetical protein